MSSWRSSAIPKSSTCAALSFETFGISRPPSVGVPRGYAKAAGRRMRHSTYLLGGHDRRELLLREEAVLHREQSRPRAGGGADLGVDVLDMVADGLRRDDEQPGDLLVREAACEQ